MPKPGVQGDVRDAVSLFLADLEKYPVPSPERQIELARRIAGGDAEARSEMVRCNLRLVVHWARKSAGKGVDMADLIQEGVFGLMHAVDKYDWERGFAFSTYASWWIRQSIQRAFLTKYTIRLPLEVIENQTGVARLQDEFLGTLQRLPTAEEIEESLSISSSRRRMAEEAAHVTTSLDRTASVDGTTALGDLIAGVDPDDDVEAAMSREAVRQAISALPQPYRTVVELRFGFDDDCPRSFHHVATTLKMSERTVKRIEAQAFAMLRSSPILAAA
jgi:RNA polymerase primary sigma factor